MHKNIELFLTLAKISATCFGGGYAIIPLLHRDLVEKKGWITEQDLGDIFSIAQCTPGVISVNAATYVGTQIGGVSGAIAATLGVLTPPVCMILLVATFFFPYLEHPMVQHALVGLQACVCTLILHAVVKLYRGAVRDPFTLTLFVVAMLLSFLTQISPIFLILSAGLVGVAFCRRKGGTPS